MDVVRETGAPRRRGSALSDRQLYYSARHGQAVTAVLGPYQTAVGYVYGLDDYHIALLSPAMERWLVHKHCCLMFGAEGTYALEPRHEEMEVLVAPFRSWVERNYFSGDSRDRT